MNRKVQKFRTFFTCALICMMLTNLSHARSRGMRKMNKILDNKFQDSFEQRIGNIFRFFNLRSTFKNEKDITIEMSDTVAQAKCKLDKDKSLRSNLIRLLGMTKSALGYAYYVKDAKTIVIKPWSEIKNEELTKTTEEIIKFAENQFELREKRKDIINSSAKNLKDAEGEKPNDVKDLITYFMAEKKIGTEIIDPQPCGWGKFRLTGGSSFIDMVKKAVKKKDASFYFDMKSGKMYAYQKGTRDQLFVVKAMKKYKVTFDFKNEPLESVLQKVLAAHSIPFEPDFKYRNGKLESFDTFTITMKFDDTPVGEAFRLILAEHALEYYMNDEGTVFITNWDVGNRIPFGEPPTREKYKDVMIPLKFQKTGVEDIGRLMWLLAFDADREIKIPRRSREKVSMTFRGQTVRAACAAALNAAKTALEEEDGKIKFTPNRKEDKELEKQTRQILGL